MIGMQRLSSSARSWLALSVVLVAATCEASTAPEPPVRYLLEVSGETFVVEVRTTDQVDQLEARLASGQEGVISGELAAGDAGYNQPWSWHMVPTTVHAPDVAIEVCDGRPSMVEEDLEYWVETVERFCPWGATVVSRLP
jgi:hypothetical protein